MKARPTLAVGDGFAVPLFGDAVPAQGSMFGAVVDVRPIPTAVLSCPACGALGSHDCAGVALTLLVGPKSAF